LLPVLAAGLTLLLRLWFVVEMRGTPFSTVSPQMIDAWYYHLQALDILEHSLIGTEVFFLRPLYPYLLAGAYAAFARSLFAVQMLQTLLATGSCLLLYAAARRMLNRAAATVAAFGFALCGILIFYTGTLLYVEVTVFLSLLVTWLWVAGPARWWRWPGAGTAFGLLVICRPEFLLLLPLGLIILTRQEVRFRPLAAFAGVALAVIATVPVRNLIVARDPVLFTAHAGLNFYYGNNPAADGTWQPAPELEETAGFSHDRLKQTGRIVDGREVSWSRASGHWFGRGLRWLASNPGDALKLAARKFLLFWSDHEVPGNYYPETARSRSLVLHLTLLLGFGIIAGLGVAGMVLAWPSRSRAWPAYLFVAVHLVSALAFYVLSRLRAPVLPFLLVFAGFASMRLAGFVRERRFGRLTTAAAVAAVVFTASLLIPVDRAAYSAQGWTQWGNILLADRKAGPAEQAFRRALEADPANPSARYSLIILLAGSNRAEEASGHYRELVRRTTADPRSRPLQHLAAGRLAIARRDFGLAAAEYRAAITADPDNPESWYLLGLVHISQDSMAAARDALQQAVRIAPHHTEAAAVLERVKNRIP